MGMYFPWVTGNKHHSFEVLISGNSCFLSFRLSYKDWHRPQVFHEAFSWSSYRYSPARNFLEWYLPCNLNSIFLSPSLYHLTHTTSKIFTEGSDLQGKWTLFKMFSRNLRYKSGKSPTLFTAFCGVFKARRLACFRSYANTWVRALWWWHEEMVHTYSKRLRFYWTSDKPSMSSHSKWPPLCHGLAP